MIEASETLSLAVVAKVEVARGIFTFALEHPDRSPLPEFEAGAHLMVDTPGGTMRRYSLCSAPSERYRYVIAVKLEEAGGGGSRSMVENLVVGDRLTVSAPVNFFPVVSEAALHVLIAGGIGITPIFAMAQQLRAAGTPFRVIYCARSQELAAFADLLSGPDYSHATTLHFDEGDPAKILDIAALLAVRPEGAHVYCCGPRAFMTAVRDATKHWPHSAVHFEDFGTSAQPTTGAEGSFRVRLARSGDVIEVGPDISILEALRRHNIDVPSSCEAGTCGACRTTLLQGEADHRDFVLDDDEQDAAIMICVSRAKSPELTIDA